MSKLLIVDDESDIREFAKSFFKKRGIEVFTASGGREALDLIAKNSPDLVLLDVRMEEMTGIDLAVETMARTEEDCDGFHIMTIRTEELIPKVVEAYHDKRASKNSRTPMSSATGR